jgi:hypothetical protein
MHQQGIDTTTPAGKAMFQIGVCPCRLARAKAEGKVLAGMWKRSHGRTTKAPPDERGGNSYVRPTATAPHLDSTLGVFHCGAQNFDAIGGTADIDWPPAPIAFDENDPNRKWSVQRSR